MNKNSQICFCDISKSAQTNQDAWSFLCPSEPAFYDLSKRFHSAWNCFIRHEIASYDMQLHNTMLPWTWDCFMGSFSVFCSTSQNCSWVYVLSFVYGAKHRGFASALLTLKFLANRIIKRNMRRTLTFEMSYVKCHTPECISSEKINMSTMHTSL